MKILTAAFGISLLVSTAAFAQDAKPRTGTRDELRACYQTEDAIGERRTSFNARVDKRRADEDGLKKETEELKKEEQEANEDRWKRARFDKHVREYKQKIAAYNAGGPELVAEGEAIKKLIDSYNQQCGGVAFNKEDKDAVIAERAAAGKK